MNIRKNAFTKIVFLLTISLVLVAGKVIAQQGYGQQQGEKGYQQQEQQRQQQQRQQQQRYQQQQPKTDFSKDKIESFVQARDEVKKVQKAYEQEVSQTKDKQKAQDLQKKYTSQMISEVKDEGLTVQEYNQINQAMRVDKELREKVQNLSK